MMVHKEMSPGSGGYILVEPSGRTHPGHAPVSRHGRKYEYFGH
jgi:hypothetical protein